ncbi:MAG: hypothetical protein ACXAEU_11835 [Candidatus Hodarchaeales archaeon]
MIYLSELLLEELTFFSNENILHEVKELTGELEVIAKNRNSYFLLVEVNLLQSRLALLELKLDKARQLLTEAKQVAEKKGYSKLVKRVADEQASLVSQLGKWEEFIDRNAPLAERIKLAQLEGLVLKMIHKKVMEIPRNVFSPEGQVLQAEEYMRKASLLIEDDEESRNERTGNERKK